MPATDDILSALRELKDIAMTIRSDMIIVPAQISAVVLSDITSGLGLVQSGEFRTGNSTEPGFGFTGIRIGYPGFSYSSDTWNLAGVNNDVLQVGIKASDGKLYAGGGAVTIDASGIVITAPAADGSVNRVKWMDGAQEWGSIFVSNGGVMEITAKSTAAPSSSASMKLTATEGGALGGNSWVVDILSGASGYIRFSNGLLPAGEVAQFAQAGVVFNESSGDRDFRVESNGNANAIFVDGGNDRVGILNGAPGYTLDVTGNLKASTGFSDDTPTPYTMNVHGGAFNPADSTTYYFGGQAFSPLSTAATAKLYVPRAGTVRRVDLQFVCSAGTTENVSVYFRKNNTTDTTLTTTLSLTGSNTLNATGLSVAMAAGDYFEIKLVMPAWVTNPTGLIVGGTVYFN